MSTTAPIYLDATMLYRWRHLAPVGIVRLERMLTAHLRFRNTLAPAEYVIWDGGYRPVTDAEQAVLDRLLTDDRTDTQSHEALTTLSPTEARSRRALPAVRRAGLRAIGSMPDHLRPFAEQAAWSVATLGVETGRYVRRARQRRAATTVVTSSKISHSIDFSRGGDLVALGLGWEYIDHEAMYRLAQAGVRIHMPAFDLIPVSMPQMNAGQSHLVHRYYAEMAHYASSITSISNSTAEAVRQFFREEGLPPPHLAVNQLPGFSPPSTSNRHAPGARRHRFAGQQFILSVSTVEVRKNHLLLAKIWTECLREGVELPRLVIVGRIGWDVNELMQWIFHAPELIDRCTVVSDVDDDELVELYRDSMFTVFPSRIEGWGLPITESLTYGKACVHSTDPAQLEASQGLMPAFHPDDYPAWKAEIVRLVTYPDRRAELETLIKERYVSKSPEEYCAAYEEIIANCRKEG